MTEKIQTAKVEIEVELPLEEFVSDEQKKSAICRSLRLDIGDSISLKPPILRENVTLLEDVENGD
jgi:hypothetical protein